jgi:hypothetical protein
LGQRISERSQIVVKFPRRNQKGSPPPAVQPRAPAPNLRAVQLIDCPTVVLAADLYTRLTAYVRAAEGEITLYATSEIDPLRNEIRVGPHLFLPEQRSSASHTEVTEEAHAQVLVDAIAAGVDTTLLNVWIHSHGNISCFFSADDEKALASGFPQAEVVLGLVVNKPMELKVRLVLSNPLRVELDDLPVAIGLPADMETTIREEVAQKVRRGYNYDQFSSPAAHQPSSNGEDAPSSVTVYTPAAGGYTQ